MYIGWPLFRTKLTSKDVFIVVSGQVTGLVFFEGYFIIKNVMGGISMAFFGGLVFLQEWSPIGVLLYTIHKQNVQVVNLYPLSGQHHFLMRLAHLIFHHHMIEMT